jgi:hypothetical protein
MKKANFEELVESVREGGEILRGELKASRECDYPSPLKKLGDKSEQSQQESQVSLPTAKDDFKKD